MTSRKGDRQDKISKHKRYLLKKVPRCPGKRHPVLTQSATRPLGIFQHLLCHLKQGAHHLSDTISKICQLQHRHRHIFIARPLDTHNNNKTRFRTVQIPNPVPPEWPTAQVCKPTICALCGIIWWKVSGGSLPWWSRSFSCRVQHSGWFHPEAPSLCEPRGRCQGGDMWPRTLPGEKWNEVRHGSYRGDILAKWVSAGTCITRHNCLLLVILKI